MLYQCDCPYSAPPKIKMVGTSGTVYTSNPSACSDSFRWLRAVDLPPHGPPVRTILRVAENESLVACWMFPATVPVLLLPISVRMAAPSARENAEKDRHTKVDFASVTRKN